MAEVRVTYRMPLDGELRAWMTTQLIKYLLFMRGQIPCLYDELLRVVERSKQRGQQERLKRRRLAMNGAMKRAVKCVEAAERLFSGPLESIFALKVRRVALVFGSSVASPREAVIVDFATVEMEPAAESSETDEEDTSLDDSQTLTPPSPTMPREKLMRLCAQKLIRALFGRTMEQFSSALSATQLHIAVLAERQETCTPGFLPKQQFKLRLPRERRGVRTHCVEIYDGDDHSKGNDGVTVATNSVDICGTDMMWYLLDKPIAGFSGAIDVLNDD